MEPEYNLAKSFYFGLSGISFIGKELDELVQAGVFPFSFVPRPADNIAPTD